MSDSGYCSHTASERERALRATEIHQTKTPVKPKFLTIFVSYVAVSLALAMLSLRLTANNDGVAILWLPAGAALVALVFIDMRLWSGVALVSLISNFYFGASIPIAFGISLGSVLGAIIASFVLQRLGPWKELSIFLKALKLGTLGATVSAIISASIGVTSLYLSGIVPASETAVNWGRWVLGDGLAILLFSSFILVYVMLTDSYNDRTDF